MIETTEELIDELKRREGVSVRDDWLLRSGTPGIKDFRILTIVAEQDTDALASQVGESE